MNQGFTLIEVLVAAIILAIIGGISFSALQSFIHQKEILAKTHKRIDRINRAIIVMERDFMQMYPRAIRDENGSSQAALLIDKDKVDFTRIGINFNPNQSNLMRISYQLKDGNFYRMVWSGLDRTKSTRVSSSILLYEVEDFSMMAKYGSWHKSWPPLSVKLKSIPQYDSDKRVVLPQSIRFDLDITGFGKVTRILPASF